MEQVVIIGSGPAGLTAALYTARSQLSPLLITGSTLGGQAASSSEIENYPGFPEGISGMELTQLMQKQAERFGARVEMDEVTEVNLRQHPFSIKTYGAEYQTKTLIIASGVSPRLLGVPGEERFKGRGVSYCATCDGFFYRDKAVAVVGGGDAAVGEAIYLTRFAKKVYIIHRRDELRAQKIVQERALQNEKIEMVWNSVVTAVLGQEQVSSLSVKNVKTGEESTLSVDGMFSYIGSIPNTQLFDGQLQLDEQGYIVTNRAMHTSVPGVFAAGDVQERILKQVSTAVGSGAMAAMQAEKFIAELEGHTYPERQS
ncbi:MAG: thioredoxin-disulfide reductase [Chloroflexi bacterium]|nr:thioredoxin-disulfide reductase [Chloroflexota bacterium]